MPELCELDVLIVDCQTTGASPAFGAVLELGWGVVRPGRVEIDALQAHWIALPAGHVVPLQVRRLTGFDEAAAAAALAPEQAWERLCRSLGAAPLMPAAIHFARFELAFLRDWSSRFEPERPFPIDAVCVHAIARRLYPELPRRTLRALAGYLGHGLHLERRSLGHVEATAFIWQKLTAELAARGVRDWDALGRFLAEPAAAPPRSGKRRYPLPSSRYRALPDAPGVYRLVRSNGDVLYVGKAASLKKRVASHFGARVSREHALEMLTQTSDVEVTLTATALEAALLESESIKALRPPYNVQLVGGDRPAWFASDGFDAASTAPDAVHRFGPLPSEFSLAALGALLALKAGAPATPALRAGATGASERWAPSEDAFAVAFSGFAERHLAGPSTSERRAVLDAAKKLALRARETADAGDEPFAAGDEEAETDPERVLRHMERNVAQAYQLLRRARWLRLLYDCVVVYREPGAESWRALVVRGGAVVEACDAAADEPVSAGAAVAASAGFPRAIDRATYDRLRILTTELKRVVRDGGEVRLSVGRGRRLGPRFLRGILRGI